EVVYGTALTETGRVELTYDPNTLTAGGSIPAQADGTVNWYYIEATDDDNEIATYPPDLAGPLPFFIVRDGDIRIWDIKYTPFDDGVPGCSGFEGITTRGIVTAGPNLGMYFIQDAGQAWSGIQIYASNIKDQGLEIGDDITVTGKAGVRYGIVQLSNVTIDENHGKTALPVPVSLATGTFETGAVPDGEVNAEPYEGMLVSFESLTVTSDNADAPGGNFGEFLVTDGTGDMRVDDAGTWDDVYTTDSADTGLIYLKPGTEIGSLTGIMYYSFDNWKLEPRSEEDFVNVVTSIERLHGLPTGLTLHANYPNPFIAETGTTIRFDLPQSAQVSLRVYDATGRLVTSLVEGSYEAGNYNVHFQSTDLPSGIYLYRLMADGVSQAARMIITR
ncbi:MAG: T9SS type A sorting domain-containing protein, partial [Bacteroidetes bacterium]|nr:T9SS type A sorting domain-containing protein [Bacteroidota bacterium]